MRKIITLALFAALVWSAGAWARTVTGPDAARHVHREEMKAVKAAQRQEKAEGTSSPRTDKAPGFWEKEGERSGLGNSGSRVGSLVRSLNPVPFFKDQEAKYNARKGGSRA